MGSFIDKEEFSQADYTLFAERLQQSLVMLQDLLSRPGFGDGPKTLGAEMELSIVDQEGRAYPINRSVLAGNLDASFQLELNRFNLEYNTSPVPLAGTPFSQMEAELTRSLHALNQLAGAQGGRVVPIGILPTLTEADLQATALTDHPRYRALSAALRTLRHQPFQVCIDGPDPLKMTWDDVTLEGANTSFQVHLRVPPSEFAAVYNAAQLVSPVAVAACANSPLFLGHRLWDETRVALFKQSIDTRLPSDGDWRLPARVSYGLGWVRQGAYELFAEAVGIFPPLLPVSSGHSPLERHQRGTLPSLDELRLHQGTVWRWNRPVYDPKHGGHLRVELRSLPSGPTPLDMAANTAFLVGMIQAFSSEVDRLLPVFPFEYTHRNFYRGAQFGLDAVLLWPVTRYPSPREIPVRDLAMDLLPLAEQGLSQLGVDAQESKRMLDVIRVRIQRGRTGARWQSQTLEHLERRSPRRQAVVALLNRYVEQLDQGDPVGEWTVPN